MLDDAVVKRPNRRICQRDRVMDHESEAYFRYYRGRYPVDGYDVNTSNPMKECKIKRPPPIRGC